ncbi:hypothetical protein MJ560_01740 [Klebsiella pneumoniae]|nr:hypothetical protein MJ560_01740 [Klebsiella pneumoniae]
MLYGAGNLVSGFANMLDCIELETGRKQRLSAAECLFGYRDSIFKHEYQDRYAIVVIGLSLAEKHGSLY